MRSEFAESQAQVVNCDFRKTLWGMTKAEVKHAEKAYPLSENETYITYKDRIMGLDATVGFHFADDSLIEACYAFREYYQDRDLYLRQYERIKLILTRMHGRPIIDRDLSSPCEEDGCCAGPVSEADDNMFIVEWLTCRSIIRLLFVSNKSCSELGVLHICKDDGSAFKMNPN